MHRHMRRVGDEVPICIEHGAGEIQPLLDVHGRGGHLQRLSHVLGDGHEEVVEDLDQHGIARGALARAFAFRDARHHHIIRGRDRERPAGLHDDGLMRFDHDGGAGDARAGRQRFAQIDARRAPGAVRVEARSLVRFGGARIDWSRRGGRRRGCRARGLHLDGLGDDRATLEREAEDARVFAFERGAHGGHGFDQDGQSGIAAFVTQIGAARDGDGGSGDALPFHILARGGGEIVRRFLNGKERCGREGDAQHARAQGSHRRDADAIGGEKAR